MRTKRWPIPVDIVVGGCHIFDTKQNKLSEIGNRHRSASEQTQRSLSLALLKDNQNFMTQKCPKLITVPYSIPKAFGIGTAAGVLGSLVGMGGGFVMIPLMTSNILRLSQHTASGTVSLPYSKSNKRG